MGDSKAPRAMPAGDRIHVLTYNIRKGKGADGRTTVDMSELGSALRKHPIDIALCQEVFHCARTGSSQSGHLAHELGLDPYYGANKFREIGHHGNTTLTRLRVQHVKNHDISTNFIERRGALYVRVRAGDRPLHVFNVHLGLNHGQRMTQIEQLARLMEKHCGAGDPVLLAGDFNDWRRKLDAFIVGTLGFQNAFADHHEDAIKTWHAKRPLFNLDRIYARGVTVRRAVRLAGDPWSTLSDHLPLWAELAVDNP